MAIKAGYQGIKKLSDQFNLTTEGSLSLNVENDPDAGGSLPISGDAAKILAERDAATRQLIDDTVGWIGKNRIPLTNISIVGGNTVTVTKNANGTVTVNGTTGSDYIYINFINTTSEAEFEKYVNVGEEYELTCEQSTSIGMLRVEMNGSAIAASTGTHRFTMPSFNTSFIVTFRLSKNQTINNVVLKPMLCDASLDATFEPYHASVDSCKCDNSVIAPVENGTTASQAYAVGTHFIRNGAFCTVTQAIASGATLTENTNYTSGDVASLLASETNTTSIESTGTNAGISIGNRNYISKDGKSIQIDLRIVLSQNIDVSSQLVFADCKYSPSISVCKIPIYKEQLQVGMVYISSAHKLFFNPTISFEAGTYDICGTYICQ